MKTTIRKIGKSTGVILPSPLLRKLHLSEGDAVEISVKGNAIVISPCTSKPKYKLDDLLKQCDLKAPMPTDLSDWDAAPAIGNEPW